MNIALSAAIILVALSAVAAAVLAVAIVMNIAVIILTKVPPISTASKYLPVILEQAAIGPDSVVVDLGCGSGNFLLAAAALRPEICIGYELSPLPYCWASLRAAFSGFGHIRVRFVDFFRADISQADIVYVYLVPPLLGRVAQKLKSELKPGTVVLAKGMPLPGLPLARQVVLDADRDYFLYIYEF